MTAKKIRARAAALPRFTVPKTSDTDARATPFDLSSHQRAREALEFGLQVEEDGFNVFVLGDDRSGRMTATRAYLKSRAVKHPRPPSDWVYLNNFRRPQKPKPYRLPAGDGRRLRDRMQTLLEELHAAIAKALTSPEGADALIEHTQSYNAAVKKRTGEVVDAARTRGVELKMSADGPVATPLDPAGQPRDPETLTPEEQQAFGEAMLTIQESLSKLNAGIVEMQAQTRKRIADTRRDVAAVAVAPYLDALERDFHGSRGLARWLVELRQDVLDHLELFEDDTAASNAMRGGGTPISARSTRYAVNLLVDCADEKIPAVIVEPNPTRENLFGQMEYRLENGVPTTDFTMIRAGALHRANGGVLVLRAEAVATTPEIWQFLKAALRDREARIEEPTRVNSLPLAGAPRPKPIPLRLKVVMVGAPRWYYSFLELDPEFPNYFKVKADIDNTMEAGGDNLRVFSALLREAALTRTGLPCDDRAVGALLSQSARWAEDRTRLAASFERAEDILVEAAARAPRRRPRSIGLPQIKAAIRERRRRNSRVEDRSQRMIASNAVMIHTEGAVVGQINGLTVTTLGDHAFGVPARVTARTYVGSHGIINIDRLTGHGGPIQQKGMFILGGFMHGLFSHCQPISFSATVTFEQTYGGVEGDSASMAELCAILSSLAGLPARQDIAITGSVNQVGEAQVIGGLHHKVEGFYRTCEEAGLSGSQGVLFPHANEVNLVLRDEVSEALAAKRFNLWSVRHIDEAVELLTGVKAGKPDRNGRYPSASVYGRVEQRLEAYHGILKQRLEHV